jgi:ribosome-binding protein aMBF1 (putative translation factor)
MPQTTGSLIRKARQRAGLTQEQLAAKVGVTRWAVYSWEFGHHFPYKHQGKVEDVLGIELPEPETAAS